MSEAGRSRRQFLKVTTAAGTLSVLAPEEVFALLQSGSTFVRANVGTLNASSPDIIALKAGITAMKALPSTDRRNWINWANIHGSPSGTGPLWNTCQHGHWWFFPWHRMYLLYFERIIRKLSNRPSFSLPFWNYGASNTSGNTYPARALPYIYRQPATGNALRIPERGSGINDGLQLPSSAVTHTTAFSFTNFTGPAGSAANFGGQIVSSPQHLFGPHGQLEQRPHDSVHGAIGGFMGQVPLAARDPIFWAHHANIDRLWNLWLAQGGGRRDPPPPNDGPWCRQLFSFFDENGTQVNIRVRDVINSLQQLKVSYQGEPTIPIQTCPATITAAAASPGTLNVAASTLMLNEQGMTLTDKPASMTMRMPDAATRERAKRAVTDPKKNLVMRMEGITVTTHPGIIYEVYIGLGPNEKPDPASPKFVGTLSTFGAEHAHGEGFTVAWPIDAAAARVLQANPDTVTATLVPRGLFKGEQEQPIRLQGRVSFKRMRVVEE